MTSPPAESVLRALEGLVAAGMVGEDGRLTVTGEKVAECPVEVNVARMVSVFTDYWLWLQLMEGVFSCSRRRTTTVVKRC